MGQTILTTNQRQLLDCAATTDQIVANFYLTGGTALSEFYFKHRLSEDLDFFSDQQLIEVELLRWVTETKKKTHAREVEQQQLRGQLTFFFHYAKEVVKVDFSYFPFDHLGKFKKKAGLRIASVEDIATNKLQAILTRSRARDFYDLYVVFNKMGLDMGTLQKKYRLKFDVAVSNQELAKKCLGVYEATDMPRFLGDIDWNRVIDYFEHQAKVLMGK